MRHDVLRGCICTLCSLLIIGSTFPKEGAPATRRSFSLVIREGFGSIRVGDLNTTLYSINHDSVYEWIRENYPERCVGEILELPNHFKDWEAELRWAPGRFAVGIAVSAPTHFYGKSFLTYTIIGDYGTQTQNETYESEIRASAPVKLNLYYSFPIMSKFNIVINGGAGFYHARMTQNHISYFRWPLSSSSLGYDSFDVSGKAIGCHCSLALEYKINDRFSLLAESSWRLAKIRTLRGSYQLYYQEFNSDGSLYNSGNYATEGILYHYKGFDDITGTPHEKMMVNDEPPPWGGIDTPWDGRKAFLDLSGFTVRIGLKIGLF